MTQTLTTAQITTWEARYGCTLTSDEHDLLTGRQIDALADQRRHILLMFMQAMECPACQHAMPPRVALGRPVEWGASEKEYTCGYCHRGLELAVPVVGQDYWRLKTPLPPLTPGTTKGTEQ